MAYRCPRCKLGVDRPGRCYTCRRAPRTPRLTCVYCGAPFDPGNPHKKCLRRMLEGKPMTPYWRRGKRLWKRNIGRFFW